MIITFFKIKQLMVYWGVHPGKRGVSVAAFFPMPDIVVTGHEEMSRGKRYYCWFCDPGNISGSEYDRDHGLQEGIGSMIIIRRVSDPCSHRLSGWNYG